MQFQRRLLHVVFPQRRCLGIVFVFGGFLGEHVLDVLDYAVLAEFHALLTLEVVFELNELLDFLVAVFGTIPDIVGEIVTEFVDNALYLFLFLNVNWLRLLSARVNIVTGLG